MNIEVAVARGEPRALASSSRSETIERSSSETVHTDEDRFEGKKDQSSIKYRHVLKNAKALWGRPLNDVPKLEWPVWETVLHEEEFIAHPTPTVFFQLEHDFERTMRIVGHQKYRWVDDIAVRPKVMPKDDGIIEERLMNADIKIENWHLKHGAQFKHDKDKEETKSLKRRQELLEKGPGFGGKMTTKIARSKELAFFSKNNFTIRGNVFKLTHKICPKNIYELMPRYAERKHAHIGVRIPQFTLTTIVTVLGYGLIPVTFGVSKIMSDHLRTVITLSGEVITHKIAGAENKKCALHAQLRGVQLEIPRLIPFAGDVVNIGENAAFGAAALGIVSTTVADALFSHFSTRYTSTINLDDIGDSRCLAELNSRIDYLSQFLLPYGQYLLLKEANVDTRHKLKAVLKKNFKILRDLEKDKVKSLNYYRLALAAEKIPESHREKIRSDCEAALPETRINTHRVVKKCLALLIAQDDSLNKVADDTDFVRESSREVIYSSVAHLTGEFPGPVFI